MPTYEMPVLLRVMSKPQTAATLKRIANSIFHRGGVIRKIENLGEKDTPYKISAHKIPHRRLSYFMMHFDIPPRNIDDLLEECHRDIDLVRTQVYKVDEPESIPCTWHEEMLPPVERPAVQKLIKIADQQRTSFTHPWHWNSGLDYYPFQR